MENFLKEPSSRVDVDILQLGEQVNYDINQENFTRVGKLSLFLLPFSLIQGAIFLSKSLETQQANRMWEIGLTIIYGFLIISMIITITLTKYFENKPTPQPIFIGLPHVAVIILLFSGIMITGFDQFVTSNITPFIITNLVVSSVFIIPNKFTRIYFIGSFLLYFFIMRLFQTDETILLSNHINGLAISIFSYFVSSSFYQQFVKIRSQFYQIQLQSTQLQATNEQLSHVAYHDMLTGIMNRFSFEESFNKELSRAKRYDFDSCLLLIDIDHFKNYNDTQGHLYGDFVIQETAKLLQNNLRESDIVARWGGDEFVVLLPHTSLVQARNVAQHIVNIANQKKFVQEKKNTMLQLSIGVVTLEKDWEFTIHKADQCMYQAKKVEANHYFSQDQMRPEFEI